ncbi:SDR family oxidoreductase, partial [Pseudomonadota bacterium]
MPTVLVTGANRGLGLEFARQYATEGWRVLATCRAPDHATELNALDGDVEVIALDVCAFDAVAKLAGELSGTAIDVLINNAGIYGPKGASLDAMDASAAQVWEQVMRTNVMAPLFVTRSFAPHVAASELKRVAVLSSKMGSMADNTSGGSYIYRSSKAAVNALVKSLSHDLSADGILVAALHPGWVLTDMGGPSALIDAQQSVSGMRRVIQGLDVTSSGGF